MRPLQSYSAFLIEIEKGQDDEWDTFEFLVDELEEYKATFGLAKGEEMLFKKAIGFSQTPLIERLSGKRLDHRRFDYFVSLIPTNRKSSRGDV